MGPRGELFLEQLVRRLARPVVTRDLVASGITEFTEGDLNSYVESYLIRERLRWDNENPLPVKS